MNHIAIATAVFVYSIVTLTNSCGGQDLRWDSAYIPADTFWTVNLNAGRLLELSKDRPKTAKFKSFLEEQFKIELADVEQFQMVFGGSREEIRGDDDFMHTKLTFRTPKEFDAESVAKFMPFRYQNAKYNGIDYFQNKRRPTSWGAIPVSKKTIVFAVGPRIKSLIEQASTPSDVASKLEQLDTDSEVVITIKHSKSAIKLSKWMFKSEKAPACLELIERGTIKIAFENDEPIRGVFETASEKNGIQLRELIQENIDAGIEFVKKYEESLQEQLKSAKERNAETPEWLPLSIDGLQFLQDCLKSIEIQANGKVVSVTAKNRGGFPVAIDLFSELSLLGQH